MNFWQNGQGTERHKIYQKCKYKYISSRTLKNIEVLELLDANKFEKKYNE